MSHTKAVLDEAIDPAEIRPLVSGLITASNSVIDANRDLCRQLEIRGNEIERLKQEIETIRAEASLDPLTGLANRKTFDGALANALTENRDKARHICLVLFDIDRFRVINDRFGHLVGDRVLRHIAAVLTESVKGKDTVARFGGEEFAIILPDTSPDDAQTVAENIRKTIEEARLRRSKDGELLGKITVSAGVAWAKPGHPPEELIDLASQALLQAKRNGRNQVAGGGECRAMAATAAVG